MQVAAAIMGGSCCDGGGTLTSIIADPYQAKAAYRLFDSPNVTHDAVLAAHVECVGRQLAEAGTYLLIEDTTTAAFHSRTQASGLGPIGESFTLGFLLHNTLAVRWDESANLCQVVGLHAQKIWARPPADRGGKKGSKKKKQSTYARQGRADRESMRWGETLGQLPERSALTQHIYVADREPVSNSKTAS